jgi:hypothetical protein
MASQWAQYRAETAGTLFIEKEHGFISYMLLPDSIYIEDIWVTPEQRKNKLGLRLVEEAEKHGMECGKLFSMIRIDLNGATIPGNLKAALAVGFVPFKAEANQIWLKRNIAKPLEESHG